MDTPRKDPGIEVKGALEHNLKGVDIFVPRNKVTVVTGLSGSGKSSIAFDTIYAEGQRRYIESLSSYARQFLNPLKKPEVQAIQGLSPAIAIDQKSIGLSPRSTVGTITEIYDFMRLLFARCGTPNCPEHNLPVTSMKPSEIVDNVLKLKKGTKFLVLAPMAQGKKGEFLKEFQTWMKKGYVRARVDGQWIELSEAKKLQKHKQHDIELLIDRLVVDEKYRERLSEGVNRAVALTNGLVEIEPVEEGKITFSIHKSCPTCGYAFPELEPRYFSFNNPRGACESCDGLGVVEDIENWDEETDEEEAEWVLTTCDDCHGTRLNTRARSVFIHGKNISDLSKLSAEELLEFFEAAAPTDVQTQVYDKIVQQIKSRLLYLVRVGTPYLSMDRPARTLSGGESQRIRLATQMGSSLIGVLYVLDEPSIGLHPKDHSRLLEIVHEIRDRGNTILMVEHDEDTIRSADHIIDIGPRAGVHGGEVMAEGSLQKILANKESLTAQYLNGAKRIPVPTERRTAKENQYLEIRGATGNNLKDVSAKLPLGTFIGVTGVSGSGKSTFIRETLYRELAQKFYKASTPAEAFQSISGLDHLDKVIEISQRPIGKTPRSTPATYTGLLPLIRGLYAALPEAKIRGFGPGHFSFNVKGGRCENCSGAGRVKLEMHFLADVYVECEVCLGRRYNRDVMNIKYKDKSIADVLEMTVAEALEFFKHHKNIHRKLATLDQVGLDYITLGQSSKTLSGGEAQRVKLSKELSKRGTGRTIYILDEPTTGLHFSDIEKLIELLHSLVDQGNTVLVIEHNLEVIKNCDYILDMGPEGGKYGGNVVAQGSPEQVVQVKESHTGRFLKPYLEG